MKKTLSFLTLFIYAIASIILLISNVNALDIGPKGPHPKLMEQLNEEQQETVKARVKELWESGASREEIHTEVIHMLNDYGIEVSEDFKGFRGERGPRHGKGFMRFSDQLSEDQMNTINEKVKTLRKNGASREEIHTEVTRMLKEYGVDLPDNFGRHRKMIENLTTEQRRAVRVKMREMRENGATPEEIRNEIRKMLQEFGIDESDDQTNQTSQTSGETLSIRSYPNPFNPETTIEYNLKSSSQVSITIYDVQGKQVRLLSNDNRQAGTHTIKWDGLNESGSQVPSGVYFIRISAGNETLNHRIVMMK